MTKLFSYLKTNVKVIIVAAIVAVLVGIVLVLNSVEKGKSTQPAAVAANKTETELKLAGLLNNMKGVGEADVMINESEGEILGVVIVCQGADNIMTRNDILNAVSTALNISKSIIAIYSMTV